MQKSIQDLQSHLIKEGNSIGQNQGWRYFLGIILALFVGQLLGSIPYLLALFSEEDWTDVVEGDLIVKSLSANWNFFLMMLPFVCSFLLLFIYVKGVHKRAFLTIITPFKRLDYGKFFMPL